MWPWSPLRRPPVQPPRCVARRSFRASPTVPSSWSPRRSRPRRSRRTATAATPIPTPHGRVRRGRRGRRGRVHRAGRAGQRCRVRGAHCQCRPGARLGLRQAVATRVSDAGLLTAVHEGVAQFVDVFTAMGGLMAERATDLLDIERRIVARLVGEPEPGVARPDVPSVLVAEDLAPADTAGLDPEMVVALVTEKGGATSHTAIIARQLGIPCVVGVAGALELPPGAHVLVDATDGTVDAGVPEEEARQRVEADRAARAALETWTGPARTTDGVHIELLANVADAESARSGGRRPRRGGRAVPHRAVLPRPPRRAERRGAGRDLRRGAGAVRRARTGTSSSAPSTPGRTSRSRSPRSTTRRTRRSASAASGWPRTTRACWSVSSTGSPRRPRAAGPTPG